MKDEDLEKTKPIKVLSDLNSITVNEKDETSESRSGKYKDALNKANEKEDAEALEEALAEKNIALAEEILNEEKKNKEENSSDDDENKEGFFAKIKDKWGKLDKKKKILIIVSSIIIIILIIALIVFLIIKFSSNNEVVEEENVVEEIPTIVDNYYYKDGNLYFLDDNENEIGSYECDNKDSNLCYVAINNYRDTFDVPISVDESGEEVIQRVPIYDDDYVFIVDKENEDQEIVKLYSMSNKEVIEDYVDVKAYDDNYVIIADSNSKYGLLQIENGVTEVIEPSYEYLAMIDGEDNLVAKNSKGYIIINKSNKTLSSTFNSSYEIKYYSDSLVVALASGEYNVYNYKATLLDGGYKFATVSDKYMALVDSSNKLYLMDSSKIKYNEGNISLNNKDYVKTYIYDEDGVLEKTQRSFEMSVSSSSIQIAVYADEDSEPTYETISLIEGLINENYDYVNYFDGKLYFYSDADKTELLGSYGCTNENDVNSTDDTYDSCFIANDKIYEDNDMMSSSDANRKATIPLINNTFVFISDGSDTVKLYNLSTNKIVGTYTNVNTYTADNNYVFTSYSGNVTVVALNKKGKYGMISISGSTVSSKYSFDYNKIEKLGNYYIVQDTSNSWKLITGDNSSSELMPGKILGYNSTLKYVKLSLDSKYAVYDIDGNEIGTGYAYVELYSNYYAAVDSSKNVYIYDYDGNKLTSEGVKVGNYSYTKTSTPAFKVSISGSNYVISIYNGSSYEDNIVSIVSHDEDNQ